MQDIVGSTRELIENLFASPGVKALGAFILVVLQFLFGDLEPAHMATIVLTGADWVFGITYALMMRDLNSPKALRGVVKLGLYAGIFIVANQVETVQVAGIVLKSGLFGAVVVTEGISVLEKIHLIGEYLRIDLSFLRPVITRLRQTQRGEEALRHGGVRCSLHAR